MLTSLSRLSRWTITLTLAFATLDVTCSLQAAGETSLKRPNVLILITDEHNFRTLGCYRQVMSEEQAQMWGPGTVVETPHIDRLANEGLIGTRAYATAPVCSPSRAAMITGRYPHNTGVPTNNEKLRGDIPTLAKIFAEKGYRTSFIGKWHLGGDSKPGWAPEIDGGFEHTRFMFNRGHWKKLALDQDGPSVAARNNRGEPSYDVDEADATSFTTDFLTDRAIDFINNQDTRPFLSVVSYPDPHGPNTVREPYDHMYDHLRYLPPRTYGRKDLPTPGWVGGTKNHAKFRGEQMSRYFGMVKCIDDNVGRLLETLEEQQSLDSTIILFTSDHGDLCYEHDRLNKGNPYEGSARVPMLIRYPPRIDAETVYEDPIGTVDVTPTLLGIAQLDAPATFEGRDLTGQFASGEGVAGGDEAAGGDESAGGDEAASPAVTFLRNAGKTPTWLAAVDQRYKLVVSINDRPWLFDAESDPDELLNFFGRPGTSDVSKRLGRALRQYASKTNDPFANHPAIGNSIEVCLGN